MISFLIQKRKETFSLLISESTELLICISTSWSQYSSHRAVKSSLVDQFTHTHTNTHTHTHRHTLTLTRTCTHTHTHFDRPNTDIKNNNNKAVISSGVNGLKPEQHSGNTIPKGTKFRLQNSEYFRSDAKTFPADVKLIS